MPPRHAIFRADASAEIGGGHVNRCLTLADALTERGWVCTFVSLRGSTEVVPALSGGKHRLVEIEPAEVESTTPLDDVARANLLVVDHYQLEATFEAAGRVHCDRVMVIDDIPGRPHDCDILLDQTLGRRADEYRTALRHRDTLMLLGSGFALLRPAFATLRTRALARHRDRLERVLVSFGASDPWGLCGPAAEAACAAGATRVDIAVGGTCPHLGALHELATRCPQVRLYVNADMAPLMVAADLALGAAGSTALERCCLGLPTITVVAADNQADIAKALQDAGVTMVVETTDGSSPQTGFQTALTSLVEAPSELMRMHRATFGLCDGWGAPRVAVALQAVEAADGGSMWLRPATLDDAALLYEWQSDPQTRRFARNPGVPTFDSHLNWLSTRLESLDTLLHIVMHRNQPIGTLRLDRLSDDPASSGPTYEISIITAPGHYGRGHAAAALKLGRILLPDVVFCAEVRDGNERSRRLFQAAGYEEASSGSFISTGRQQNGCCVSP